jgi:hypothetical protein
MVIGSARCSHGLLLFPSLLHLDRRAFELLLDAARQFPLAFYCHVGALGGRAHIGTAGNLAGLD